MTIPWWTWGFVANGALIGIEYLNRGASGSWFTVLPRTAPLIVLAQFCLFLVWRDAPSMMVAWATFTVGNSVLRVAAARFMLGESVGWLAVAGVVGMLACSFLVKRGMHG